MKPKLTVGMATRGEPDHVWFVLQALHANHPKCDYVVVDNTPERDPRVEAVTRAVGGRYYHRPDLTGTSAPRDAVFRFSRTEWTMCVDSHVVFETGAIAAALAFADANSESRDIVQGPLIGDDGKWFASHWNQPAPPGLWGEWSQDRRALDPAGAPFEIPMMGLGCWMMRTAAWPGFSPYFRGFGGEEGYIHEVVRRAGGRALCLPALRWRHKFRDVSGWHNNPPPPYPLRATDHVWNLLAGHRELGINALPEIMAHFGKGLPVEKWNELAAAAEALPVGRPPRKKLRVLGVWYSDNSAPPALLARSLTTVLAAAAQSADAVASVSAVAWEDVPGFRVKLFDGPRVRSHATIARQIGAAVEAAGGYGNYDAVAFMEHDVLYPPDYFDRVARAFAARPNAQVFSNADYIGLNGTGWQRVRERHEPMHQLAFRSDFAQVHFAALIDRAERGEPVEMEPPSETTARAVPGLLGVDMDGTVNGTGLKPPAGQPFVLITGRPDTTDERLRTLRELARDGIANPVELVHRDPTRHPDSDAGIAAHKSEAITRLGVKEFWEDNPRQVELIRRACPGCAVRLVRNGKLSARDTWARVVPADPGGMTGMPSVHVNHTSGRFTSHGEVVYEPRGATLDHPHWGRAADWWPEAMAAQPSRPADEFKKPDGGAGCTACEADKHATLREWYEAETRKRSDFNEHLPRMFELAARCKVVTELSGWWKPADAAFAAGLPADGRFVSITPKRKPQWATLARLMGPRFSGVETNPDAVPDIPETDLLFIDTAHTAAALFPLLDRLHHRVSSYLVVHCTETFGEWGDRERSPGVRERGVLHALRSFCNAHKEWVVRDNDRNNHGLIVLSKRPEDVKELPSLWRKAMNYTAAMARYIAAGRPTVPLEVLTARENECALCPERALDACAACGCPLEAKLPLATEECGLVKKGQKPKWEKWAGPSTG